MTNHLVRKIVIIANDILKKTGKEPIDLIDPGKIDPGKKHNWWTYAVEYEVEVEMSSEMCDFKGSEELVLKGSHLISRLHPSGVCMSMMTRRKDVEGTVCVVRMSIVCYQEKEKSEKGGYDMSI